MTAGQFFAILRARWVILLSIIGLTVVTATGVSLWLPKQYTATAEVVLDIKSPDPIAGMVLPGVMSPTYMATQMDLLESDRVARKVVSSLNLASNDALRANWLTETKGEGEFEGWIVSVLSKNLKVTPSRESNVIKVDYTATDAKFAAVMANAFVQAYITVTSDLRIEPARQFGQSFEQLAKQLRVRLEEAQNKLATFQKSSGLMATDERLDVETARLNELSSQVVQLQAISTDATTRRDMARERGAENSSEIIGNVALASLKSDLAREEARLTQLEERMGSAHPAVRESRASVEMLRAKARQETDRTSNFFSMSSSVNEKRLASAQASLAVQRDKLLKLKEQRNSAAVITRDVENLQRAYDAVQARVTQSIMESQSTQTNQSVIQSATPPLNPSKPRTFLNIVLALVLGTAFAVVTVLGVEMLDRRVRSNEDISMHLGAPVIGVLLATENAKLNLLGHKAPPWVIGHTPPLKLQNT